MGQKPLLKQLKIGMNYLWHPPPFPAFISLNSMRISFYFMFFFSPLTELWPFQQSTSSFFAPWFISPPPPLHIMRKTDLEIACRNRVCTAAIGSGHFRKKKKISWTLSAEGFVCLPIALKGTFLTIGLSTLSWLNPHNSKGHFVLSYSGDFSRQFCYRRVVTALSLSLSIALFIYLWSGPLIYLWVLFIAVVITITILWVLYFYFLFLHSLALNFRHGLF